MDQQARQAGGWRRNFSSAMLVSVDRSISIERAACIAAACWSLQNRAHMHRPQVSRPIVRQQGLFLVDHHFALTCTLPFPSYICCTLQEYADQVFYSARASRVARIDNTAPTDAYLPFQYSDDRYGKRGLPRFCEHRAHHIARSPLQSTAMSFCRSHCRLRTAAASFRLVETTILKGEIPSAGRLSQRRRMAQFGHKAVAGSVRHLRQGRTMADDFG